MIEFYLLTFPRFPLQKKEHKSYFGKNRTHDFRTSRCADYLLDQTPMTEPDQIKSGTCLKNKQKKQGKQTQGNGQESSLQRTLSLGRGTQKGRHKPKQKQEKQTKYNHITRVEQEKHPRQQAMQERCNSHTSSGIQPRHSRH